MFKQNNIVLLSIIVCIGGFVFFLACKYNYDLKKDELKQKAKAAFEKTLGEELKRRNVEGESTFQLKSEVQKNDMPDSVYLEDESGRYKYRLDAVKSQMNMTNNSTMRMLHSIAFLEKPISLDTLNATWKNYLVELGVLAEPIIYIELTNGDNSVNVLNKTMPEWCTASHLMFTVYIGYACEIEALGYIHYSFWNMMGLRVLCYLLIYIVFICTIYKLVLFVQNRITQALEKRVIEVPVIKVVQDVGGTPIRSYVLHENIIFYAEKQIIEVNGVEKEIPPQASQLLELFFHNKDNDYILSDKFIIENLWGDKYAGTVRLHKAINRLRSVLHQIDSSISIMRNSGTFQLII